MNNACTVGEINYLQNCYKKLNEECKLQSFDSTDINLKAATNTNCELLGTLINIFKDSTQIVRPIKSSKYNIASNNESSESSLVNKVISSEKIKLKDVERTTYFKPAIQEISKIGSGDVGSSGVTNASISTSGSTISDERVGSPAVIQERTYTPTVVVERKSTAAIIEKRSGTTAVDEKMGTAAVDEKSGIATFVYERRGSSAIVDERSGTATAVYEKPGISAVNESSETSAIDGRSGNSTVHEICVTSIVYEISGTSAIDETSRTSTVYEISGTSAIDETSGTSAVDETSGTSAVDETSRTATVVYEKRGISIVDNLAVAKRSGTATVFGERTGTPNFSRRKTELYKSPIRICKEMNEKIPNLRKPGNKVYPDIKSIHSLKLRHRSDLQKFIEDINSVNTDTVQKSVKLFQKQTLVSEIVSYIQATQSVCRLSLPRNILDDRSRAEKQNFDFSSSENFHSAGECVLEELHTYFNGLKADYEDWETKRISILHLSESIPRQFELCYSEYSTRTLMHEISTGICAILQEMNDITSRRETRNTEFEEIWKSIDLYIRFSNSFISL